MFDRKSVVVIVCVIVFSSMFYTYMFESDRIEASSIAGLKKPMQPKEDYRLPISEPEPLEKKGRGLGFSPQPVGFMKDIGGGGGPPTDGLVLWTEFNDNLDDSAGVNAYNIYWDPSTGTYVDGQYVHEQSDILISATTGEVVSKTEAISTVESVAVSCQWGSDFNSDGVLDVGELGIIDDFSGEFQLALDGSINSRNYRVNQDGSLLYRYYANQYDNSVEMGRVLMMKVAELP